MSAGMQVRDFIEAPKVAEQFLAALTFSGVDHGRPHLRNVGTGCGQTLLEFAQYWWKFLGATGRLIPGQVGLRPGELARLVANINDVHVV
jgi:UDP-glucose 4-epimerase